MTRIVVVDLVHCGVRATQELRDSSTAVNAVLCNTECVRNMRSAWNVTAADRSVIVAMICGAGEDVFSSGRCCDARRRGLVTGTTTSSRDLPQSLGVNANGAVDIQTRRGYARARNCYGGRPSLSPTRSFLFAQTVKSKI